MESFALTKKATNVLGDLRDLRKNFYEDRDHSYEEYKNYLANKNNIQDSKIFVSELLKEKS